MAKDFKGFDKGLKVIPIDTGANPITDSGFNDAANNGVIYYYANKLKAIINATIKTLVDTDSTQDLSNKSLVDGTDATKKLSFDLSGATTGKVATLTSSHTADRVITVPDATCTLATSTLNNLGTTSINTTLVSDTDNTDDLGTTAVAWKEGFINKVSMDSNSQTTSIAGNAAASASVAYTLPAADGTAGQALTTNASGVMSWATKATPALDNLASVAINTTLVSDTDNTDDLGTTAVGWKEGFINKISMDSNSQTTTIAGHASASASVNYTLPAADGTSGQVLSTNASGVLSWVSQTPVGATPALDNLASVAINTSLISDADNTDNLGSGDKGWAAAYVNKLYMDSNSQTTTIAGSASASASVNYTLPAADGTSGQCLTTNASGALSWTTPAGTGATTALDNLASVAINTSLVSDTDNTDDLGSSSVGWKEIFVNKISMDSNSQTTTIVGSSSASASVNYVLPAADGTSGQVLSTNASGVLSWITPASAGATTALDNLAAVAINTSLVSDTDATDDLGSSSVAWANGYINKLYLDSNSQTTTIAGSSSASASVNYILPAADGSANQVLKTNGSGVLSWADNGTGAGASTALDNLASVAINTSLISDADNTDDLGSSSKAWKCVYNRAQVSAPQAVSALEVDWATGTYFTKSITADSTFTFANSTSGQSVTVIVTNNATAHTITMPTAKWYGGVAVTAIRASAINVYSFINIGGTIYASCIDNMS